MLIALAGVILLLLGVGVGLVIAASYSDDDAAANDRPAADSAAVGFAQDMIRHHEQGVEMAAIELTNGTDPQVRSMAFDILTTQSNEIGQMQSWLSRWGYPVINPDSPMAWMSMSGGGTSGDDHDHADGNHAGHDHGTHDHGAAGHDEADDHDHGTGDHGTGDQQGASGGHGASDDHADMPGMSMPGMGEPSAPGAPTAGAPTAGAPTAGGSTSGSADEPPMPGMATAAEMDRLRTLRGRDADVDFLQLMLRHHEGGLHMMEYAANPANVTEPYVRDLASAMLRTQNKEIGIITAMLAERGAQPLPMN
ncbi:DUF305 domain-containing protein [Gordonia soli]|uniref:DUF305 domain-containing protein n=1 Tax=Gordonia soli TaxID=320799 RepID=UPI003F71FE7C